MIKIIEDVLIRVNDGEEIHLDKLDLRTHPKEKLSTARHRRRKRKVIQDSQ